MSMLFKGNSVVEGVIEKCAKLESKKLCCLRPRNSILAYDLYVYVPCYRVVSTLCFLSQMSCLDYAQNSLLHNITWIS